MGARHSLHRYIVGWSYGHVHGVRERNDRLYTGAIDDAFILMQDNPLARTVRVSMTFLDDEVINVMNWPAMSPGLHSIEHTWDNLSRRIRQRPQHPEHVQNTIDTQVQELQAIPQ